MGERTWFIMDAGADRDIIINQCLADTVATLAKTYAELAQLRAASKPTPP